MSTQTEPVEAPTQPKVETTTQTPQPEPQPQAPDVNQQLNDMFRKGYGEAKDKFFTEGQTTVLKQIAEATGREFSNPEDVIGFIQANPVAEVTEHSAYKTLEDKYKTLQSEYEQVSGRLNGLTLDSSLQKEASEALSGTNLVVSVDDALALFKQTSEIEMEGDSLVVKKDGVKVFNDKQEPYTAGELFRKFVEDKGWIANSTVGTGGGSSTLNGAVANPWSKDTFNLTEQGRIMRENEALATQLKQEAGV